MILTKCMLYELRSCTAEHLKAQKQTKKTLMTAQDVIYQHLQRSLRTKKNNYIYLRFVLPLLVVFGNPDLIKIVAARRKSKAECFVNSIMEKRVVHTSVWTFLMRVDGSLTVLCFKSS